MPLSVCQKIHYAHITLVLMKQHSTKGKVPHNLKAHLPFLSYETLIKSCVNDKEQRQHSQEVK